MLNRRVLVIEDYDPVAQIESLLVTMEGYDVRVARTGDEGMTGITDFKPDLVVLDLMLPGKVSGQDILTSILEDGQATPRVLVVSALVGADLASRFAANQRVATLTKPFRVRELSERMRSLMEGAH
ncbi:MAG: response regulator transcription factor [Candidatus Dormibacteria bacterium]